MQLSRVVLLVLSVVFSGAGSAARPPLAERVVGTWQIVLHQELDASDGKWKDLQGSQPRGYLVYDRTGHMSLQIAKMPRPQFSAKDGEPTPLEARAAVDGYLAYFGTYSVNESTGVVTHHVEGSLWPDYVGTDQQRPATIDGDRLTLSDGKTWRVVWSRVNE